MSTRRLCSLLAVPAALLLSATTTRAQRAEIHPEYQDTTVAACRDFYSFANGGWLRTAQIPASSRTTGASSEAADRANSVLEQILTAAAASYRQSPDRTTQRLGAFYASCMDSARADREGIAPLKPELARIDAIKSRADLA